MEDMASLEGDERAFQEKQAIQYFINGCRDGTLLKHKLMCSEPTSLAVLMAKADKYATADSAMRVKVTALYKVVPTSATPKPAGDNRGGQNNYKRKANQEDPRSNGNAVGSTNYAGCSSCAGSIGSISYAGCGSHAGCTDYTDSKGGTGYDNNLGSAWTRILSSRHPVGGRHGGRR
ncbi:Endoglucanase 3 [Hordeum vulgare]|nr:Endoglucanase 3 [Hordeum vulgare]